MKKIPLDLNGARTIRTAITVAIISCLCVPGCRRRESAEGEPIPELSQARWIEPRLTGASVWTPCSTTLTAGRVIESADCGGSHLSPPRVSDCSTMTETHTGAIRTLITQPPCIDAAVARLETDVRGHAPAGQLNDLAAAYYLRAQKNGDPADLLRSLEFSKRAVEADPSLREAQFNVALAEEALDLPAAAARDWSALVQAKGPWLGEAGQHLARVNRRRSLEAAAQWPLNRERLRQVVRAGDRAALSQLIRPFPAAAQRYVEEEVLALWAAKSAAAAQEELHLAASIAEELARLTGDHYALDAVEVIERAAGKPQRLRMLRDGHAAFAAARTGSRPVITAYREAATALGRAGSPMAQGAVLGLAIALSFDDNTTLEQLNGMLTPAETFAHRHGYWQLEARVQAHRGYLHIFRESRYADAFELYDAALHTFERIGDLENSSNARTRKSGVLRTFGNCESAWREAFLAQRSASSVVEVRSRHITLGEAAAAAVCLSAPRVALLYQDTAIEMIKREGKKSALHDNDNLAIAFRARAGIEAQFERREDAERDLNEAIRLATAEHRPEHEDVRRAVLARVEEVQGQLLLQQNQPRLAVQAFTRALLFPNIFASFRASLFAQRAEAHALAGGKAEATSDLESALRELHAEEQRLLPKRKRGLDEELWGHYFDRFQETYQRLIRQLADKHRDEEAFAVAERARGYEPLNLVLQLQNAPQPFRDRVKRGEPFTLEQIQALLPRATFLIAFRVLEDRTLAWIVSHDHFELVSEPVPETQLARWSEAVQRAAADSKPEALQRELAAPFAALLAQPLAKIAALNGGRSPERRLVIIPHGFIHALPLAALRDARTGRYLIQDFPVSIAPSGTLYIFSLLRDAVFAPDAQSRALLVGDPAFDIRSELFGDYKRLPFAREEVVTIKNEVYGDAGRVLVDTDATVPAFLDLARERAVVHLAVHAVVNPHGPAHSVFLLAPSPNDSGALEAETLLKDVRLEKTRLVVLAACSSAGGLPIGPEGLGPLVRPLVATGVPAVVGSIWRIHDAPSKELMVAFHRHYRAGLDAALALRQAQLEQINQEQPAITWAPFQVIGYASSPFAPRKDRP